MTLVLFRVNTAGQGLGNLDANEQITFNANTDIENHNGFITQVDITNTTGIGNNQAAEQDLGDHQDLGPVEKLYVITGFISVRDEAESLSNLINIMQKWDTEIKTNTNFKHGRMGLLLDDFSQYDLAPIGTGTDQQGLIWKSIEWGPLTYDILPLRADFKITMIIDLGDDE